LHLITIMHGFLVYRRNPNSHFRTHTRKCRSQGSNSCYGVQPDNFYIFTGWAKTSWPILQSYG